jgi:hypothetical protein
MKFFIDKSDTLYRLSILYPDFTECLYFSSLDSAVAYRDLIIDSLIYI